jgi:hypothetical protein
MECCHCGHTPANRPRNLCWNCYAQPAIRAQHASKSKYAPHGALDTYRRAPLPPTPTRALPGTPEKVAVLIARAALMQALWHPHDAPARTQAAVLSESA